MGRKAHIPDPAMRRQVETMAAYGIPETDISRVVNIDPKTLRKHYRDELDTGSIKANSRMAENLYRKAMGDGPQSVTATIFWLKTRAQWKETSVQEQHVTHSPVLRIVRHIVSPNRQGDDANSLVPAPLPVRLIDQVVEDR
jgi:hypothetical protein